MPYVAERAPAGWKEEHVKSEVSDDPIDFDPFLAEDSVDSQTFKRAGARLLRKSMRWTRLYARNVDWKMKCSFAGETAKQFGRTELQLSAVIQEPEEIKRILRHLVRIGRSPPRLDHVSLN